MKGLSESNPVGLDLEGSKDKNKDKVFDGEACKHRTMMFGKWRTKPEDAKRLNHENHTESIKGVLCTVSEMLTFPDLDKLADTIKRLAFVYASGDEDTAKVYRIWLMDSMTKIWCDLSEAYLDGSGSPVTVCMELEGASDGARRLSGMLTKLLTRFDIEVIDTDMIESSPTKQMLDECVPIQNGGTEGSTADESTRAPKTNNVVEKSTTEWFTLVRLLTSELVSSEHSSVRDSLISEPRFAGNTCSWKRSLSSDRVLTGTFLNTIQDLRTAQGAAVVTNAFCEYGGLLYVAGGYLKESYETQWATLRGILREGDAAILDLSERKISGAASASAREYARARTYRDLIEWLSEDISSENLVVRQGLRKYKKVFLIDLLNFVFAASEEYYDLSTVATLVSLWMAWTDKLLELIGKKQNVAVFAGGKERPRFYAWLWMVAHFHIPVFILDPTKSRYEDFVQGTGVVVQDYPNELDFGDAGPDLDKVLSATMTDAAMRDILVSQDLEESLGIWTPVSPQDISVVRLETAWGELASHWQAPARVRTGFSLSKTQLVVPAIFVKIIGSPAATEGKLWKWLSDFENDNMIVLNSFFKAQHTFEARYYGCSKEKLMLDERVRSVFGFLQPKVFERVCHALTSIQCCGAGEHEDFVESVLNAGLDLGCSTSEQRKVMKFAIAQLSRIDYCGDLPKILVLNSEIQSCSVMDALWLWFFSTIGFDVMVVSLQGACDVESVINNITKFYKTERLDTKRFKFKSGSSVVNKRVGLAERMRIAFDNYINGWEDE